MAARTCAWLNAVITTTGAIPPPVRPAERRAVEPRHAEIEQDQVDVTIERQVERLLAVDGGEDLVALLLEEHDEHLADVLAIVDARPAPRRCGVRGTPSVAGSSRSGRAATAANTTARQPFGRGVPAVAGALRAKDRTSERREDDEPGDSSRLCGDHRPDD